MVCEHKSSIEGRKCTAFANFHCRNINQKLVMKCLIQISMCIETVKCLDSFMSIFFSLTKLVTFYVSVPVPNMRVNHEFAMY